MVVVILQPHNTLAYADILQHVLCDLLNLNEPLMNGRFMVLHHMPTSATSAVSSDIDELRALRLSTTQQ